MEPGSAAVSPDISLLSQDISLPAAEDLPSETDAPVGEESISPPAPETVHAWLAQIKAAAILALLREPDFAYISMAAFAGVRVNPTNYALPMVRGRLVREAVKNSDFADKLQALAIAPTPPFAAEPAVSTAVQNAIPPPVPNERELLKAERERVKTMRMERDGARLALTDAQAAREQAADIQQEAEIARADAERRAADSDKDAGRLRRRIERLKDEAAKLGAERDSLRKSLKQALSEPRPTPSSAAPEPSTADSPASSLWRDAAAHLLNRRRYELALMVAEEVLRLDPGNMQALDMAAQAHEARREKTLAASFVRILLEQAVDGGRLPDAADAWLRLARLVPPGETEKPLQLLLRALRPDDAVGVRQMRVALSRLQGFSPGAHEAATEQIARLASSSLAEALMPPPGALMPDDPLPLGLPLDLTARTILEAVDTGDDLLVTEAREAWARLVPSSEDAERVRAALERASGDDSSLLQPLLRVPRGPVLVDASNVALHGQEMLARPRPRLRALQAMRRALLMKGWFPVLTVADANLPHNIDDPNALAEMRARRAVRFVDSGTQADETLLREAKRLSAPIVTNDYMTDWDPQAMVTKIRYTFSHNGDVYFDQ